MYARVMSSLAGGLRRFAGEGLCAQQLAGVSLVPLRRADPPAGLARHAGFGRGRTFAATCRRQASGAG